MFMKFIRKLFLSLGVILLLGAVLSAYNRLTDGFNMHQIESSLPFYPEFELPALSPLENMEVLKILDQPFHYLGKGCQFYVFESDDGQYVIKFLKQKHVRSFEWLRKLPASKKYKQRFEDKIQRRQARLKTLFSSCMLAYHEMRDETGLVFLRLNRKQGLNKEITIHDKLGMKHKVDLDNHEFILQKKCSPLEDIFKGCTVEEMTAKIHQLIDLVNARCQKGIKDRDRAFVQNIGFCLSENRPLFIDIGQFCKDNDISDQASQDIEHRLKELSLWMENKFPEGLPLIKKCIEERMAF